MGTEIERKYLVTGEGWRARARPLPIRQGYLCSGEDHVVRVRTSGEHAFLTIKGGGARVTRLEFEYEIPSADANALLDALCERPLIEKTRYAVDHAGAEWVVDVFAGENEGLVVAEIELASEDQPITPPEWVGAEVTHDPKYLNAHLGRRPFSAWTVEERAPHR